MDNDTKANVMFPAANLLDKYPLSNSDYEAFKIGYSVGYSAANSKVSVRQVLELLAAFDEFHPAKNGVEKQRQEKAKISSAL